MAIRSLFALADQLRAIKKPLQDMMSPREASAAENFFTRTVEASGRYHTEKSCND